MCSVLVSIHCLTKWLLVNSFAVMAHMQILMTASSLAWGTVEGAKYAIARENLPLADSPTREVIFRLRAR